MIRISTLNDTRFTLNDTEYLKNYISVVKGNRIEVFNCYERKDVLVPLTQCSAISLNGTVYETADELQSALLQVTYSRFTLGNGSTYMQNNKGRTISLGYLSTDNVPFNEVLSKLNAISFMITETESPVLVTAFKTENESSKKFTFLFLGGKGSWGQGASPIASFNLVQLSPEALTVSDIQQDDNSVIISLPDVTGENFLEEANAITHDFSDGTKAYYLSYVENGVLYISKFIGVPAVYGFGGALLTNSDFVSTTNTEIQPGQTTPSLDEIVGVGNIIHDKLMVFSSDSETMTLSESGIDHDSGEKQISIRFAEASGNSPESVTYTVPSKSENDEFAMTSDIRNLNLERVLDNGNQASTPIYINNYQIDSDYDAEAQINIDGRINLYSGNANTLIGKGAGKSNAGNYNSGYGAYALVSNTTGGSNTAIGYSSLWQNVSGSTNCAVGHNTLASNMVGKSNVAIGYSSLPDSNSDSNVGIGYYALRYLSTGIRNCAIGRSAGNGYINGIGNVVLGYQASASNAEGNHNTVLGCSAMQNATGGSSNIWIGGMSTNSFNVNVSQGSYNTFIGTDLYLTEDEKLSNNHIVIADGQGNRAVTANMLTGDMKLMGRNPLLVHPDSLIQIQNICIGNNVGAPDDNTLYLIEETSIEYHGEFSAIASAGTIINIPHNLDTAPSWVDVTPANMGACGMFFTDKDETNIIVTYLSPPSGNLKFNIAYKS